MLLALPHLDIPNLQFFQNNPFLFVPLVTLSDMIPFVPCQPIAVALGSTIGWIALPICAAGQLLAALFSFIIARKSTESTAAQNAFDTLPPNAKKILERIKNTEPNDVGEPDNSLQTFATLIALRFSPFPFSAGNYVIGSLTNVGLRSFGFATAIGCIMSNFASVGVGVQGMAFISPP